MPTTNKLPPTPSTRPPRLVHRLRFGLRELLALMFVVAVASAYGTYLRRALSSDERGDLVSFVLLVLVSPLCLLTLVRLGAAWRSRGGDG